MRVIAGSARRLLLKTVEGLDTRPTTDRIKETLFNVLQNDVPGCMFLDLFSGSGAIGIEALSRGASLAVLIEKNPKAAACIRENLEHTRLADRALVHHFHGSALRAETGASGAGVSGRFTDGHAGYPGDCGGGEGGRFWLACRIRLAVNQNKRV